MKLKRIIDDYMLLHRLSMKMKRKCVKKKKDNKKYYIIRRDDSNVGIFSCILTFLTHIYYAEKKGYIPVIDMMNFDNEYLTKEEIGKKNAWDFYFEQPAHVSIETAYCSRKAKLSSGHYKEGYIPSDEFLRSTFSKDFHVWKSLWNKYIIFNKETDTYLKENYCKIIDYIGGSDVCLGGVLCRGSDYFHHTTIQSLNNKMEKLNSVIEKVKKTALEQHCKWIFLATEDEDILQLFKEKFGNQLLYIEDWRVDSQQERLLGEVWKDKKIDLRKKGLNYILNFYILSRCNWFVGSRTSASVFIPIVSHMNYRFFYDLDSIDAELEEEEGAKWK